MTSLMQNQIKRESPGLADVLSSPEFIASNKPAQYSPETDKNLEAVSQNANGVNYLDKTTNQILTAQQAIDKYGQVASATTPSTTGNDDMVKKVYQVFPNGIDPAKFNDPGIKQAMKALNIKKEDVLNVQANQGNYLSPEAQAAYNAKTIPDGKNKDFIRSQLQQYGAFDEGKGNLNYFEKNAKAKEESQSFIKGYERWNRAKDIVEKYRDA